jgi:ArsR family transcriptional regulator
MALNRTDFQKNSTVYKILSSPIRLEILHSLKDGERSVFELLKQIKIRKSALSQHLAILRNTELVSSKRSGQNIIYSINNPELLNACSFLSNLRADKKLR